MHVTLQASSWNEQRDSPWADFTLHHLLQCRSAVSESSRGSRYLSCFKASLALPPLSPIPSDFPGSCEGNKQPTQTTDTASDMTTPTLNVMKISFFPTGIRTVCPSSTPAIRKKEATLPCVTTHMLLQYLQLLPSPELATTAAPGTRPTSGQHSNTLHRSPGAVSTHLYLPGDHYTPSRLATSIPDTILLRNSSD